MSCRRAKCILHEPDVAYITLGRLVRVGYLFGSAKLAPLLSVLLTVVDVALRHAHGSRLEALLCCRMLLCDPAAIASRYNFSR